MGAEAAEEEEAEEAGYKIKNKNHQEMWGKRKPKFQKRTAKF